MPFLYVIATPIGNLEDVTLRAIRTLKEVKLIATEDTRKTRRLLDAYGIKTPMTSYHEHNKLAKLPYLLERLTIEDVALVSEAGMPGISDPGYELVLGAIKQGTPVVPVPGVSAITTAVTVSGLPADRFLYLGFFPARAGARRRFLQEIAVEKATLVAFETPHRLTASLKDLLEILGDRRVAVCRELTKLHEEVFRGTVSQALSHFTSPRGEFTLVIEGNKGLEELKQTADIESRIKEMRRAGKTAKEATSALSEQSGLSRKELYRIWLKQKQA
ncbi:MAG: 16S rRNA (cytidine(1402)-2'-O)-methyltransferase [Dehalococcoidia bacterium]|nr:16S rRNA (cytidine(1402)-2'-O)-methyltransferase [Dehalococcoidia bacterium]